MLGQAAPLRPRSPAFILAVGCLKVEMHPSGPRRKRCLQALSRNPSLAAVVAVAVVLLVSCGITTLGWTGSRTGGCVCEDRGVGARLSADLGASRPRPVVVLVWGILALKGVYTCDSRRMFLAQPTRSLS